MGRLKDFLLYTVTIVAVVCMLSCTNDDDVVVENKAMKPSYTKLSDGTELFVTDRGEVIHITDTTVYDCSSDLSFDEIKDNESYSWNMISKVRRAANYPSQETVYGFDTAEQLTSYVKMAIGKENAAKYGIPQGTYLVCLFTITKKLAKGDNEAIQPRSYPADSDDVAMGWSVLTYNSTKKLLKGFDVSSASVDGYVMASTLLRYIKCNLAGASYNKFAPYEPSALTWQYVLSYSFSWE